MRNAEWGPGCAATSVESLPASPAAHSTFRVPHSTFLIRPFFLAPTSQPPLCNPPLMSVRSETTGPVTTVVLSRPERRNAVDGATADALADAFRRLRAPTTTRASPCSGARAARSARAPTSRRVGEGRRQPRRAAAATGPMGPTRMAARQAGDRGRRRARRRRRPRARAVVRSARRRGDAVFGVFCRRWGVPLIDGGTVRLPRVDRAVARARHDPHRPRRRRATRRSRWGLANRVVAARARARGGRGARARASPRSRSAACAPTAGARSISGRSPWTPRSRTSSSWGWKRSRRARRSRARRASPAAPAATAPSRALAPQRLRRCRSRVCARSALRRASMNTGSNASTPT